LGSICGHLPPATFRPFSTTGPKQAACSVTSTPESSASIAAYTFPAPPNRGDLFPSQPFQPIDSCTYAQADLLWPYTGNREGSRFAILFENGIGFVPHLWFRPSCRAPHPAVWGFRCLPPNCRHRIAPYCPKMGLASFRTGAPGILAVRPTPPDWLRFAFSVCLRPAPLPIGFVPHPPPPCAPSHPASRADLSIFPTRTRAFKLYCGYRGIA
jgi:hypothetical protein